MNEREIILAEARHIAGQPRGDALDGKQGQGARDVMLRLLESAGLDYGDAIDLMSAFEWNRWRSGYAAGREVGRELGRH